MTFLSIRYSWYSRLISLCLMVTFVVTMVVTPKAQAGVMGLPMPGTMVNLSPAYVPLMVTGLTIHPENPLLMDFIVSTGNSGLHADQVKEQSNRLIKYFLACLTIPENDQWVNLSPYEKQRIVPEDLGQTVLGQDMLAQDYLLKQLTASLIYPEKNLGKDFWNKVYAKASQMYGTSQIPVNTFNKVWILPGTAKVFEHKNTVFVVKSHLKVMLDEDYLALSHHAAIKSVNNLASQVVRQIILPAIEQEVNYGHNFAQMRQIYNSMILAVWFKKNLKQALLNQVYTDKAKVNGVNADDPAIKEKIYKQYLQAYKKGVFNYIKEEVDQNTQETIPRKYFSGGLAPVTDLAMATEGEAMAAFNGLPKQSEDFKISGLTVNQAMNSVDNVDDENPGTSTRIIYAGRRSIPFPFESLVQGLHISLHRNGIELSRIYSIHNETGIYVYHVQGNTQEHVATIVPGKFFIDTNGFAIELNEIPQTPQNMEIVVKNRAGQKPLTFSLAFNENPHSPDAAMTVEKGLDFVDLAGDLAVDLAPETSLPGQRPVIATYKGTEFSIPETPTHTALAARIVLALIHLDGISDQNRFTYKVDRSKGTAIVKFEDLAMTADMKWTDVQGNIEKWLPLAQKVSLSDINPDMFRDYDYRFVKDGVSLKPEIVFMLALVWAKMALKKAEAAGIKTRDVLVARDARKIEPEIADAEIAALRYAGLNVVFVGDVPNCVTSYSWAVQSHQWLMTIFNTASHVSQPENVVVRGFKVTQLGSPGGNLLSLSTKEIKNESFALLKDMLKTKSGIKKMEAAGPGKLSRESIEAQAIRFNTAVGLVADNDGSLYQFGQDIRQKDANVQVQSVIDEFGTNKPLAGLKVVVEGSHTPSGPLATGVFRNLGAGVEAINQDVQEISGLHSADPSIDKNLEALKNKIIETHADFGIAFDLDGDRGAILIPEWDTDGKAVKAFHMLAPDNILGMLMPYLLKEWGYSDSGKRVGVIRDVLGTYAVNDAAKKDGVEMFQTDAGYVYLKAMKERMEAQGYVFPVYGERSGHTWLNVSGEIENPVAVAVLFSTIVAKFKEHSDINGVLNLYKRSSIPYSQSPRFQPFYHPGLLQWLSEHNKMGWTYIPGVNPPQAIVALGKDHTVKLLGQVFYAGARIGRYRVSNFNTYQDPKDEGGLYRFADIMFDKDARFAGRVVVRASSNDPTFVMSYEAPIIDGKVQEADNNRVMISGLVMHYMIDRGLGIFTRNQMKKFMGYLPLDQQEVLFNKANLGPVEEDLKAYADGAMKANDAKPLAVLPKDEEEEDVDEYTVSPHLIGDMFGAQVQANVESVTNKELPTAAKEWLTKYIIERTGIDPVADKKALEAVMTILQYQLGVAGEIIGHSGTLLLKSADFGDNALKQGNLAGNPQLQARLSSKYRDLISIFAEEFLKLAGQEEEKGSSANTVLIAGLRNTAAVYHAGYEEVSGYARSWEYAGPLSKAVAVIDEDFGGLRGLSKKIQDFAMLETHQAAGTNLTRGGIDLNSGNLKMQSEGQKVDIAFDPAMIAQFKRGDFSGVKIQILEVVPIDLMPLLGLKENEETEKLAKV